MKICDAHNDFLTDIKSETEKINYINFLNDSKIIKYIAGVIWTTELHTPLETITKIYDNYFLKNNKKLFLCLEDLGFITENNFSFSIDKILNVRPFSCGIVWNYNNNLGGGALGNSGLTNLGIRVIKKLEDNNVIIDTAHMNEKTFWEFCKITSKPLYNSHSNLMYFKNNKRNLTDKQIKAIINSNGFMGLSFVQTFISNNLIDTEIIAKQLAYFVQNYGENNIGIGSDFYGTKKLPINLKNYIQFKNLKKSLKKQGLSNKTIKKILYMNFINFIKRNKKSINNK